MIMVYNIQANLAIIIGTLFVPFPSSQHFIWPLSWCLLADFCNHTWIPECGFDELENNYRLFIDDCDMFEYNCDHEKVSCPSKPTCPDHRFHRMGDRYVFINHRRRAAVSVANPPEGTTLLQKVQALRVKIRRRFYTPQDTMNNYKRRSERTRRSSISTRRRTRPKGHPTRYSSAKRRMFVSLRSLQTALGTDQITKIPLGHQPNNHKVTPSRINKTKFKLQTVVLKKETIFRFGKKILRIVKDYELANYSDCFRVGACPTQVPCPSNPTCPNHKFHRMGDHYVFLSPRRQGRRMASLHYTLPINMMKGKRRYTPEIKKRRDRARLATKTTTPRTRRNKQTKKINKYTKITMSQGIIQTVILNRQSVKVNGKKFMRIVKGIVRQPGKPLKIIEEIEGSDKTDSDFLE